ncbi:hypothetical protein, partial [Hymenobacter actinosclerus]|uniref:hypothetical protein n=1 Tax=Hymenobacter actinosclerus TaxID=82805 RepID=UPI001C42F35D
MRKSKRIYYLCTPLQPEALLPTFAQCAEKATDTSGKAEKEKNFFSLSLAPTKKLLTFAARFNRKGIQQDEKRNASKKVFFFPLQVAKSYLPLQPASI